MIKAAGSYPRLRGISRQGEYERIVYQALGALLTWTEQNERDSAATQ